MTALLNNKILLLILLLGIIIRVYQIDKVPLGFFADEAAIGYNAYTIAHFGTDEFGRAYPLLFQSFSDFKQPLAIYLLAPIIYFGGLSETTVRLGSALWGLLTIFFLYLIGKEAISKQLGLWTAFTATITPWFFHYNRVGFDCNSYLAFFTASVFLLLKSIASPRYIIPFFIIASATLYSYQPAKLMAPLLVLTGTIIYRKYFLQYPKQTLIGLLLFIIISIPIAISLLSGEGLARFNQVSVFTTNKSHLDIALLIIKNYLIQLDPGYLFVYGEPSFVSRHFIEGMTPLLLISSVFILVGVIKLIRERLSPFYQLLLCWLVFYPLGATFVNEGPYTHRSIVGASLMALVTGVGIISVTRYITNTFPKSKKVITSVIVIALLLNLMLFLNFYFTKYPLKSANFWGWQYGPQEIISYFLKEQKNYDEMYMSGEFNGAEVFINFYDPEMSCQNKCRTGDFYRDSSIIDLSKRQLFSLSPDYLNQSDYSGNFKVRETIYYPDGTVAFVIGEIVKWDDKQ